MNKIMFDRHLGLAEYFERVGESKKIWIKEMSFFGTTKKQRRTVFSLSYLRREQEGNYEIWIPFVVSLLRWRTCLRVPSLEIDEECVFPFGEEILYLKKKREREEST